MQQTLAELIGPDFLQRLGEQQLASGMEIDFATLQANAQAWNAERATLEQRNTTIAEQERDLRGLRDQLQKIGAAAHAAVQA